MNSLGDAIGLLCVAFFGVYVGLKISRAKGNNWLWGCTVPMVLLFLLAAVRFFHVLVFIPPFSFLLAGRFRFVVLALAITVGLTTPIARLRHLYQKVALYILMAVFVIWFAVLPLLMPSLMKERLLSLPTILDSDGICLQSTNFTCAPAAAVTALGKLGFSANEGRLAFLSYSNPITGTLPVCLEDTLRSCYGDRGLDWHFRHFDSVEQLKSADLTLAIIKSSFLTDHCIVVLKVGDKDVFLADPVFGKTQMTRQQFEKVWRFTGITLKASLPAHHI